MTEKREKMEPLCCLNVMMSLIIVRATLPGHS